MAQVLCENDHKTQDTQEEVTREGKKEQKSESLALIWTLIKPVLVLLT